LYKSRKMLTLDCPDLNLTINVFKELQLLQNLNNYSIGKGFTVPFMFVSFIFSTFGPFALLSFYHVLDPVAIIVIVAPASALTLYSTCFFLLSGRITAESVKLLTHLSEIKYTRLWKARVTSMQPLRTYIGIFFYVEHNSVLIYCSMVVNTVINLIISYGR